MITDKILLGLVVVTVALFAGTGLAAHVYVITVYALVFGLIWFILVSRKIWSLSAVIFMLFLGLAIWGCLENLPVPAMLLGLSTDLAAWDLSRFRARIAAEEAGEIVAALESRHLRYLSVIASAGFVIAVLPLFVKLSINFVGLAVVALLAMLVLRQSIRSARRQ